MQAVPRAVVLRRLLLAAGLALLALLLVAGRASAAGPERYNCPVGFIWDRMSGTACVQEKVPTNGKIGYDGHALCIDPYVGIYEFRPTTDGKPPPGAPYTSFSYLLECVTPAEFEARQARAGQPAVLADAARLLASEGRSLPPGEVILLGALGSGTILIAAAPAFRRQGGLKPATVVGQPPASTSATESAPAAPPAEEASQPVLPTDPDEIRRRLKTLDEVDVNLRAQSVVIREKADAGRLTPQDVVAWAGIVSDLVGLLPFPPTQLPAGIVSMASNIAGLVGDAYDTRALDRAVRANLADVARMQGIIAAEREQLTTALDANQHGPVPEEPPEAPPVDPALLPDETLRAERDRLNDHVSQRFEEDQRTSRELDRLRAAQRQQEDQVRALRRVLDAMDADREGLDKSLFGGANTTENILAGLDGFVRAHQEGRLAVLDALAHDAMVEAPLSGFGAAFDRAVEARAKLQGVRTAAEFGSLVGGATAALSAQQWLVERSAEQAHQLIEQAIEGHQYQVGRLDQDARLAQERANATERAFHDSVSRRNALRAEFDRRSIERGEILWPR